MSRIPIILALLTLSLMSCRQSVEPKNQAPQATIPQPPGDAEFETLANAFIQDLLKEMPEIATLLGDHRYDHLLNDYSPEGRARISKLNQDYLEKLQNIDPFTLSPVNQIDRDILMNQLHSQRFLNEKVREYEWNPLFYNVGQGIYPLIARDFAPLKDRLLSIKARLEGVPSYLEQAKTNLTNPPKVHTETAILQNQGTIHLIQNSLEKFVAEVPEIADLLAPAREQAVTALTAYGTWLKDHLLPRSDRDFRLGHDLYTRKLRFTLESDLSPQDIYARAQKDLKQTQEALYQTASELYGNYFDDSPPQDAKLVIRAVLNKLAEQHPNNETIVEQARQMTITCSDFVREKNLVSVPDAAVQIIVMPEFQRGVAVAYCDSPGPFESSGATFYAIAPTPTDWPAERVASFFREYNNFMLENLTVHEAMPGHYLQLAHSNKFKAPTKIRAIFYSGTFVEGWATYAEQIMVEAGYGGGAVKMQQLKMRLRLIINAMIDQQIHAGSMTESEAMALMMEEGFQEEGEAAGKWRRACLTSTQLSTYYIGNLEINDLRQAYEAKHGIQSPPKKMHDDMLSFGSPAAKHIKKLLEL